jgi:hypothetical protein
MRYLEREKLRNFVRGNRFRRGPLRRLVKSDRKRERRVAIAYAAREKHNKVARNNLQIGQIFSLYSLVSMQEQAKCGDKVLSDSLAVLESHIDDVRFSPSYSRCKLGLMYCSAGPVGEIEEMYLR